MFNATNLIPKNLINGADNILTKIDKNMRTIDSGIGTIKQIENSFLGKSVIGQQLGNTFNTVNILKNNALNGYGFIKNILGLGGATFLEKTNGSIAGIPVLVKSTSFSRNNTITQYATFDNKSFSDNIYIEDYKLSVELICYGVQVIEYIKELVNLSEQRHPISFHYEKLRESYSPVVISDISYSEDYQNQNVFIVSLTLKEIKILNSQISKVETTNVFKNNDVPITTKELTKVLKPTKKTKTPNVKWVKVNNQKEFNTVRTKFKGYRNIRVIFDKDFAFDYK